MLLDVFEYNQHFVAMMNIINAARLNPLTKGHRHHIVPRCWFKMNNLPIDNSDENLVLLSYEDHCKVHRLMSLCSTTEELRHKMICAYNMLMKGTVLGISYKHTQETRKKMSESRKGMHHSKETKNKMSESMKGKLKGRMLSIETKKKMSESQKGHLPYFKGMHHSKETKNKISESHKGILKNKTWKVINGKRVWLSKETA